LLSFASSFNDDDDKVLSWRLLALQQLNAPLLLFFFSVQLTSSDVRVVVVVVDDAFVVSTSAAGALKIASIPPAILTWLLSLSLSLFLSLFRSTSPSLV
jgi:hypothetical protein